MKVFFSRSLVALLVSMVTFGSVANLSAQSLEQNLIKDYRWRNIGNANLKGRICCFDVLKDDFAHIVVGTASGGVWKSVNAGTTWTPIFDKYGSASIGAVKINQNNPDEIWVGGGERNGRNTAAWGDGLYKSTDGGNSFDHVGFSESYTIADIEIHPENSDIVHVAVLGCVWGHIGQRGLYKTTDGGKNWEKVTKGLPDDGRTGALEIVVDPSDVDTMYVTFWERLRRPWVLKSGGPNGGIFKSTDGGKSWSELTNGLPEGDSGRIGLAVAPNNPKVLMAHYEHGYQPARGTPEYDDLTKLGSGIYRSEDAGASWKLVNRYFSRPFYYNELSISPHDDKLVYSYTISFQYSEDGGKTLQRMPSGGGHCWHAMWLDPHNKNRFWQGNDAGLYLTHDGGKNYVTFKNLNVTQYYAIGVDMQDPYWVYGGLQDAGTSGGPNMSRDSAVYTSDWVSVGGGDGFHVQIDPTDHTTVYSTSQPGNSGGTSTRRNLLTGEQKSLRPTKGRNIVNYDEYITPEIEKLQEEKGWGPMGAFRWNWSSPFVISSHNPRTIFYGANHLFKSEDRGDTWHIISPDLSKNEFDKTTKESGGLTSDAGPGGGAEFYGTLITVGQSPLDADIIWTGTDDGNIHITRNGGHDWTLVSNNISGLPSQNYWVSRVEASHYKKGTAYVTIDGHRSAYFDPMVYKTDDFGQTWTNITSNLPSGHPCYVIRQDRKNENLLFVGTEFAIFYSIDEGKSWAKLNNNLPTVAIHDLLVHPRDPDLVIGTHGRGLWVLDDISALQQATPDVLKKEAHLFENEVATKWLRHSVQGKGGSYAFSGENPTKNAVINYYLGDNVTGDVQVEIADATGKMTRSYTVPATPGIGKLEWDMRLRPKTEASESGAEEAQRRRAVQGRRAGGNQGGQGRQAGAGQGGQGRQAGAGQ
ncbi:MAG: hypothetical protein MPJ24_07890, partial [Pirellulaceae bacterium]|nr:hypothetical protein [Pirellulaceae bacterium]